MSFERGHASSAPSTHTPLLLTTPQARLLKCPICTLSNASISTSPQADEAPSTVTSKIANEKPRNYLKKKSVPSAYISHARQNRRSVLYHSQTLFSLCLVWKSRRIPGPKTGILVRRRPSHAECGRKAHHPVVRVLYPTTQRNTTLVFVCANY